MENTITGYKEINNIKLNEKIFTEGLHEYEIRNRLDFIDTLIEWISEATQCKELMKEDLKYLINLDDEYIFSSISTNKYIVKSDSNYEFNNICKELLELNESLNDNR